MSWLSKTFKKAVKSVADDALGILDIPSGKSAPMSMPQLVGPTDADVLAADQRLRRRLAGQGKGSTVVSGGKSGSPARLTMPTLIGL